MAHGYIARGGQQPTMDGMSMVSSHPRWSFNVCTFTLLYNILRCSSFLIEVYGGRRREMVFANVWAAFREPYQETGRHKGLLNTRM